jgi:tripartite-type tricarboxylate transporter receptor subunit TctC
MKRFGLGTYVSLMAAAAFLAPLSDPARAQAPYPSQTIKFIVPYAPGGLPDTVARIVGQRLTDRLGQPVVIENRAGGNGSLAAAALTGVPADGYTFLVTDGSMLSVNPLLFKQVTYDAKKDFVPVVMLARAPLFLATHPDLPVTNLQQFVAYVKARPGQVNYGSSGLGSTHHLTMEAMKSALQLEMTHVPYRGTGQSVPALLGGHVPVLFSAYPSLSGAVESKLVRLIATNGAARSPQAPDVPPIADLIPGFDFSVMVGILARAGTPKAIVDRIANEAMAVVTLPEVARLYAANGIEAVTAGPERFGQEIAVEMERVAKVIASAGIKVE